MMFTYHRNMVIAAFRARNPDSLEVTEAELEAFDASLNARFDAEMRTQMALPTNNIPVNKFNLSMLVFLSARSTAKLVTTQVRHGCKFFLSAAPTP